nr:MAG TPA_asm: Tor inhibition protein helix, reverse turn, PROTEIN [Caudoviricetes sp.]
MEVSLMDKITISLQEAVEITGIGYKQLIEWSDTDDSFPVFRVGRKRMVEVGMLREWLRNRCRNRVGMDSTSIARIVRKKRR